MKKLFAAIAALTLALTLALPAGALSLLAPEYYNERYTYYYIDYNHDGRMELVTLGGEGGYSSENKPCYKIYTYADDEVKLFAPAQGSRQLDMYSGAPIGYRNWLTGQRKWISKSGHEGWDPIAVKEMRFDFQSLQYQTVKTRTFAMNRFSGYGIFYRLWKIFWRPMQRDSLLIEGVLTPERIEELLLHPPASNI